jgi:hypothetical protein
MRSLLEGHWDFLMQADPWEDAPHIGNIGMLTSLSKKVLMNRCYPYTYQEKILFPICFQCSYTIVKRVEASHND